MKVVILAGGLGTRLAEETEVRPKPMVEIGGRPILWHIMKHYARYGFNEFVLALGYKGESIKRYFLDYSTLPGSMTISLADGDVTPLRRSARGLEGAPGGHRGGHQHRRPARALQPLAARRARSCSPTATASANVGPRTSCWRFHRAHGKLVTLTAVRPPARFGGAGVRRRPDLAHFTEKPQLGEGWINGGFFVVEPQVLDYIDGDVMSLETRRAGARWRPTDSLWRTGTKTSGSAWTRCATCAICGPCGRAATPPGSPGEVRVRPVALGDRAPVRAARATRSRTPGRPSARRAPPRARTA